MAQSKLSNVMTNLGVRFCLKETFLQANSSALPGGAFLLEGDLLAGELVRAATCRMGTNQYS